MTRGVSRDRHKHKKHGHAGTSSRKYGSSADSKAAHHKTAITLDNIPDSLLPHRSLINFVDDRSKLLDELFSIFSEEEISNMLPDILKGIKLDEVQKLCYEQLKAMDLTTIKQIIQSPTAAATAGTEDIGSKTDDVGSNEDDAKVTSCDQHESSHDLSKQKEGLLVAAEVNVISAKNSPHLPEGNIHSDTHLLNSTQSTVDSGKDISTTGTSVSVPECSSVNEDSIELLATVGDDIDRELTLPSPPSSVQRSIIKQIVAVETAPIVSPVVTTPTVSVSDNDISETTAVLVELRMRKRALQSQLKKQQLDKKVDKQRTKEELLLRQKALQSLLAANVSKQ